ncbi:MAG: ABC transporter substrate-binding protein [Sphingomicrobium sp.]|nr:extracellular solute-binding protein [Sphingomonadales bacterium]
MKRLLALALTLLVLSCAPADKRTHINLQRFFGECGALYGHSIDVAHAEGECGIMTTLINRFNAENPDVHVDVNVVAWPGYAQLSAQIAARDPPDLVTMHQGVLTDYAARGLVEPVEPMLRQAGLKPDDFTDAGRRGVTKNGAMYGVPWDTIGGLFHINTALFAKAGLLRAGKPVLPTSPRELLAQARQFKERTGTPYFIQSEVNDPATQVRNLYTYLLAQDAVIFPDAHHIRLTTHQAKEIVTLFKTINDQHLSTLNQDTPAAINSFLNGQGGIYPTGTWMIGSFQAESETPGRPLYRSYAVFPYPRLWGHPAAFVDGHSWVMPKRKRSPATRAAIARFLAFMAAHNFDWSRTGHVSAMKAVVASAAFKQLPHRADIAPLAEIGRPLPGTIRRQGAIEGILGEELAAAISGQKPVAQALADAERRTNTLLAQLD